VGTGGASYIWVVDWPLQHIVVCRVFCTRINTIICKQPLCVGTPLPAPHRPHYCAIFYIPPISLFSQYMPYDIGNGNIL